MLTLVSIKMPKSYAPLSRGGQLQRDGKVSAFITTREEVDGGRGWPVAVGRPCLHPLSAHLTSDSEHECR